MTVHLQDQVTGLQTAFTVHGRAGAQIVDLGQRHQQEGRADQHQQEAGDEIHGRSRHQDAKALPPGSLLEGSGVIGLGVLPFHGAVTTDGNAANGIKSLTLLLLPDGRSHKHGKLIDLHTGSLRCQKMSKLMDKNQNTKDQNCKNYAHRVLDSWNSYLPAT